MNKVFTVAMLAISLVIIAACAPTPPPTPTLAPLPTAVPTVRPPTVAPTSPPAQPTAVPPTAVPPPTAAPTVPPQPTVPPGLYVTNMRIQPVPTYNTDLTFYATFLNSTDRIQNFTWLVYIYKGDEPWKTNNETSRLATGFPVGAGEYTALGKFRYGITGRECDFFFARVAWLDQNNKATFFSNTDGKVTELQFKVCMPSALPTSPPAVTAPTAPPSAPGPGLFVTGIRTDPEKPGRNTDVSFYVNFANTTDRIQNFTWLVYIYKGSETGKTTNETSRLATAFPVGRGEYKAQGTFKFGYTAAQCDDFVARVVWLDQNNKATTLTNTDGRAVERAFSICN